MAEKEYIERKDLINNRPPQRNPNKAGEEEYNKGYNDGIRAVLACIENQPAADVVEVVRCKDCEYMKNAKVNKKGFMICSASGMEITDNDYCSYGERNVGKTLHIQ